MAFDISAMKRDVGIGVCSKAKWRNIVVNMLLNQRKTGSNAGRVVVAKSLIWQNVQGMLMRKPTLLKSGRVRQCLRVAPVDRNVSPGYTWHNTCEDCTGQVGIASVEKISNGHPANMDMKRNVLFARKLKTKSARNPL